MYNTNDYSGVESDLLGFAEALGSAVTADQVFDDSLATINSLITDSVVAYYDINTTSPRVMPIDSVGTNESRLKRVHEEIPDSILQSTVEGESAVRGEELFESSNLGWEPTPTEIFIPVVGRGVFRVLPPTDSEPSTRTISLLESVASVTTMALSRIEDERQTEPESSQDTTVVDAEVLRQFHDVTVSGDDFDDVVTDLLSIGRDYLKLDTGVFSHIESGEYTIKNAADQTNTYTTGMTIEPSESDSVSTRSQAPTESVSSADVSNTEDVISPIGKIAGAYIEVPIFVDEKKYRTIVFSVKSRGQSSSIQRSANLSSLLRDGSAPKSSVSGDSKNLSGTKRSFRQLMTLYIRLMTPGRLPL